MFSRIRMRTVALVFGALVGAANPIACQRHTPKPEVTLSLQDRLLAVLPKDMRQRVQQLLTRGFNPCPEVEFEPQPYFLTRMDPEIQALNYKTIVMENEGRTGQINCLATVEWVVSGVKEGEMQVTWKMQASPFMSRIKAAGYKKVEEMRVLKADEEGLARAVEGVDLAKEKFKPGDILVFVKDTFEDLPAFKTGELDRFSIAHAALYLDEVDGTHFMFQKGNSFCSPGYPYEVTSLEYHVDKRASWPITGGDDGSFTRLIVYRQQIK